MREYSVAYSNLTKRIKEKYKGKGRTSKEITSFIRSNTIKIETFQDLVMEIAELSYKNPDVMLFYRGQNSNYIKKKYTTLYPTIYRSNNEKDIRFEFDILKKSAINLINLLQKNNNIAPDEIREIKKIKLLQYSILQHYEVCKTPLLDVTQSLKVACSFARLNNENNIGYVYVLGLPYITGRISVDSEDYITNVRLLSISCSASKRPFFQEGYLVQTEFTSETDIEKGELDFNRRLVAVYEFENDEKFWGPETPIDEESLYPKKDIMKDICNEIKNEKYYLYDSDINRDSRSEFLTLWNSLEEDVRHKTKNNNFWQGIVTLSQKRGLLYGNNIREIDSLCKFRNKLVPRTNEVTNKQIQKEISKLKDILNELNINF